MQFELRWQNRYINGDLTRIVSVWEEFVGDTNAPEKEPVTLTAFRCDDVITTLGQQGICSK